NRFGASARAASPTSATTSPSDHRVRQAIGPLVALAALVVGILAGERAGPSPAAAALAVGGLALAGARVVAGRAGRATAGIALALLGCAVTQRALDGLSQPQIEHAVALGDIARVRGTLAADPDGQRFGVSAYVRVSGFDRIVLAKATGDDAGRLRL